MKKLLRKLLCLMRGHRYNTPVFQSNVLYYCSRCGREMFDRTLDDLQPMTDEEWEMWDRFDRDPS